MTYMPVYHGNVRSPAQRFELRRSVKLTSQQVQKRRQMFNRRHRAKNPLAKLADILIEPIFQLFDKRIEL